MVANTLRQATLMRIGDTLGWDHVEAAVGVRIRQFFSPEEVARFEASRQARGTLLAAVAPLAPLHPLMVAAGALVAALAAVRALRRGQRAALALVLVVAVGADANAFAAGALSKPHHRYQARIAWLIPLAAGMVLAVPQRARSRAAVAGPQRLGAGSTAV
jgi:hypothetical protein